MTGAELDPTFLAGTDIRAQELSGVVTRGGGGSAVGRAVRGMLAVGHDGPESVGAEYPCGREGGLAVEQDRDVDAVAPGDSGDRRRGEINAEMCARNRHGGQSG